MLACASTFPRLVELLVSHGANPYLENLEGRTAVDIAYERRREAIIRVLEEAMHSSGTGTTSEYQPVIIPPIRNFSV